MRYDFSLWYHDRYELILLSPEKLLQLRVQTFRDYSRKNGAYVWDRNLRIRTLSFNPQILFE